MATVNHHLVEIALGRTEPTSFEQFCQVFFGALTGTPFVPLGGHHDGGAEAFSEQDVFEGKAGHFWQASVEKNIRAKIRRTAKRLRTFGRDLKQLTYCSSIVVPNVDGEEDFLSDELGIRVGFATKSTSSRTSTTPRRPPKHSTRISRRTLPSSRQSAAFQ